MEVIEIRQAIKIDIKGKCAKVGDVCCIPPKTKKNKKLDCQKRKHKSQYNSTILLNNSKHNKNIYLFI